MSDTRWEIMLYDRTPAYDTLAEWRRYATATADTRLGALQLIAPYLRQPSETEDYRLVIREIDA